MWRRLPVVCLGAAIALASAWSCRPPERPGAGAPKPVLVRVPGRPQRLAAYGGKALVSVFGAEGGVAIVDPETQRLEALLPGDPKNLVGALAVAGDRLFVAEVFANSTLVFDLRKRQLLQKLPVGGGGALAAAPDGRRLYFGHNDEPALCIIDAATCELRKVAYPELPTGQGKGCSAAIVSPDGKRLYLGIQRPTPFLAVYDIAEGRFEHLIHLYQPEWGDDEGTKRGIAADLAFSADGKRLFVGMSQSVKGILVVDCRTHEVVSNIAFEPGHIRHRWADPVGLARYGERMVVAVRNRDELAILDEAGKVVAAMSLGMVREGPIKVLVLGDTAFVSHPGHGAVALVDLRDVLRQGTR